MTDLRTIPLPRLVQRELQRFAGTESARLLRGVGAQLLAVTRALDLATSRRSHPVVDGRTRLDGPHAAIEVLRDAFGVPHIFAADEADALFGQGFVHAQDRLFQLEATRRLALGRLAEVGGPRLVESDRFMRRLGLADRAGRDFARTDDAERELLRERLLRALGPERTAEVDVGYPADAFTSTGAPPAAATRLLHAFQAAHEAGLPAGAASNAWALTSERAAGGAPMMACDPHLQSQIPGFFHVSHVSGGSLDVVGAGVAGLPGVAIGHNRHIAWGLTAGLADVADCYVEELHPEDPTRYRTPQGWKLGRTRIERIAVLGGETVEERVLETRHGPIVGPALQGETRAIALRSTALEEGSLARPYLDMARAANPWEFEAAVARWPASTFNFVWAHVEGGIGYRLGGQVPRRAHGEGLLPAYGPTSDGPSPPLPPEALPRTTEAIEGMLVSANNAPGGDLELGAEFCEPVRAERIGALLRARTTHTVASMQAIQFDRHSEPLLRLRDLTQSHAQVPERLRPVLGAWDGALSPESVAATVLESVYVEVARALVTRLAGPHASIVLGSGLGAVLGTSSFHYRLQGRILDVLTTPREPWLADDGDRDRVLGAALSRALAGLRTDLGAAIEGWRWGSLHRLRLDHPLVSVPVIGRMFSRGPFPYGGDSNTVNQGGYTVQRGPGLVGMSAAYRQVIDLANVDRSTFGLPSGNNGIPGHPRYDDFVEEHLEGRQRPLLFTREAVERHVEHRLTIEPIEPVEPAQPGRANGASEQP